MAIAHSTVEVTAAHDRPRRVRPHLDSIGRLADRVRHLHRTEPAVGSEHRTSVLTELAAIELLIERLALDRWRQCDTTDETSTDAAAITERLDRLSVHWSAKEDMS